ncbi:MAG: hypothetical protein Q4G65_15930 [bacterium]|nr:hypothetical protein [bacterium]
MMGGQYAFHIADFDDVILDGFDVRGNKDGIHGNCACDLMLHGIRHSGREPLVSLGGYGERTLRNRILLTGSMFGPNGAKLSFAGAKTHARVLVEGCLSDGPIQVVTDRGATAEVLGQANQN